MHHWSIIAIVLQFDTIHCYTTVAILIACVCYLLYIYSCEGSKIQLMIYSTILDGQLGAFLAD